MVYRKFGKVGNIGNLGKIIPSFRFYPTLKIENSDFKITEKFFQDFRLFRVFDLTASFQILVDTFPQLYTCTALSADCTERFCSSNIVISDTFLVFNFPFFFQFLAIISSSLFLDKYFLHFRSCNP